MKVLMVGWEYPPMNSGGLGVACQGIVEHLVDAGQEVVLVLPQSSTTNTQTMMFMTTKGHEYKVIFVFSFIKPYPDGQGSKYGSTILDQVNDYSAKVFSAVKDEVFDIIHIHDWLTVPAGLRLKKYTRKPLVMHVHSTEYDRTAGGLANFEVEKIEKEGFELSDKVVTVSNYTKSIVSERYGIGEDKIEVIHNGINAPRKGNRPDFLGNAPLVIFVGRLTIQKGAEFFIRMAKRVLEDKPETIFVVAGDGDMYKYLVEFSAFSELTGSVLFSGFLRDENKDQLYERADLLVMPSVSEPFGLVALEAASVEVPVIISKTSGVAEVLPSALLVDFWDTDLTAKYILELLENEKERRNLGEKMRQEALAVTWNKAANTLKEIYQNLYAKNA